MIIAWCWNCTQSNPTWAERTRTRRRRTPSANNTHTLTLSHPQTGRGSRKFPTAHSLQPAYPHPHSLDETHFTTDTRILLYTLAHNPPGILRSRGNHPLTTHSRSYSTYNPTRPVHAATRGFLSFVFDQPGCLTTPIHSLISNTPGFAFASNAQDLILTLSGHHPEPPLPNSCLINRVVSYIPVFG